MKRKKGLTSSGSGSSAGLDIGQIEQLLKTMSEHNLEEFEYSRGDLRIRLKKPSEGGGITAARAAVLPEIIVARPPRPPSGKSYTHAPAAEPRSPQA